MSLDGSVRFHLSLLLTGHQIQIYLFTYFGWQEMNCKISSSAETQLVVIVLNLICCHCS